MSALLDLRRDSATASDTSAGEVTRAVYAPPTWETDLLIPAGQAAIPAVCVFGLATVGVFVGGAGLESAVVAGTCAGLVTLGAVFTNAVRWAASRAVLEEVTTVSERIKLAALKSESATVRIEVTERRDNGGVAAMHFDELPVALPDLRALALCDSLSRRQLQRAGLSFERASQAVAALLAAGYARRDAGNEAAVWTAKGNALRRGVAGGGVVVEGAGDYVLSDTESGGGEE